MVTRRNLLILGIVLIAIANVIVFVLGNHFISYSSFSSSGSFSLAFLAFLFGLVGFWLIMWGIFGKDFRGYPKAKKKEETQD